MTSLLKEILLTYFVKIRRNVIQIPYTCGFGFITRLLCLQGKNSVEKSLTFVPNHPCKELEDHKNKKIEQIEEVIIEPASKSKLKNYVFSLPSFNPLHYTECYRNYQKVKLYVEHEIKWSLRSLKLNGPKISES